MTACSFLPAKAIEMAHSPVFLSSPDRVCVQVFLSLLCGLLCALRQEAYENSFCVNGNHDSPGPTTFSECLLPDTSTPILPPWVSPMMSSWRWEMASSKTSIPQSSFPHLIHSSFNTFVINYVLYGKLY